MQVTGFDVDFCKIDYITPAMLTSILPLTNFVGYTGLITYLHQYANVREGKL